MSSLGDLLARLFRRNDDRAAVAAAAALFTQPSSGVLAPSINPSAPTATPEPARQPPTTRSPAPSPSAAATRSDAQPVPASTDPAFSNQMSDFPTVTPPPTTTASTPPTLATTPAAAPAATVVAPLAGLEAAIRACAPRLTDAEVASWLDALSDTLRGNAIDTPRRIAAFVGQCAHESGGFKVMQENLNYRAERLCQVWPARFPNLAAANECARNPERLANRVYASRMGNGDEASGDGWRFRGRGLIQLTGRSNYQRFANSLGCTVEEAAQRAETPRGAGQSAAFFWSTNGLNALADAWSIDAMTRKINGGTAGAAERRHLCDAALAAIGE